MFISRIRNIGEHGAVPDNDDRLRNTRTTHAGFLERALIAPYFVNYHLEHHLLVSCPCYRLPRAHALLIKKGFGPRMETKPNYLAMLRHAVSRPEPAGGLNPASLRSFPILMGRGNDAGRPCSHRFAHRSRN